MYRLMIVDDEYMIHRSLRKLVESSGLALEVTADAEDGAEALQVLQEQDIDIVVTDIHMPEMNGLAFIEAAQRLRQGIGFIILSGYNDFEYARQAIRFGVSDFLLKPIEPELFLSSLQTMMSNLEIKERRFARHNEWLADLQKKISTLSTRIWETNEQAAQDALADIAEHCRLTHGAETDPGLQTSAEGGTQPGFGAGERTLTSCAPAIVEQIEREMEERGAGLPAKWSVAPQHSDWPAHADQCLAELQRIVSETIVRLRGSRNLGARHNMAKVLKYLDEHYADPELSLPGVAAVFGMSDTYLSRTLKEEMNENFAKYLIRVRLAHARTLLETTELTTTEIAERVGFSDYPHFSKTYKKHYGLTPTENRKMFRLRQ